MTAVLIVLASLLPAAAPFEIRGWDIERFDPAHVFERIEDAHTAGMNTISLSHEIVMNAEEIILDWHRYKHLRRFCDKAHSFNMKVYLWNHQINNPPPDLIVAAKKEGDRPRLKMDNPKLYEWLADRYERVVQRVPNLDGIILSLTESEFQIPRDNEVITSMNRAERMAKVIHTIHAALSRHGKRLIVRDFLRYPPEMESFRVAMTNVPDDIWVYTKCVPNDWHYKYPPHPLLGKVKPHKQIMELDLSTEVAGACGSVMPAPGYYRDQLQLARQHGLAGAIARTDDGFYTNVGTPGEFNVWAYSKLLHNPEADVEAMWTEWYTDFYGKKAAPVAIACLKECFEMVCALRYSLGFWTGTHDASVAYADGHLIKNSSALWSDDPGFAKTDAFLKRSGPETVRAVVDEKRKAGQTAKKCIKRLDEARDLFDANKFAQLRRYFVNAERHALLGELWVRTYFALRWYRNTKSPEAKQELDAAMQACRVFINEAERKNESPQRIPQFIREVEREVAKVDK